MVSESALVEEKSVEPVANVLDTTVCLVPSKVVKIASRSHTCKVLSFGVADADVLALCAQLQKCYSKNKNLFSRRAGSPTIHMHSLLRLYTE